MGLTVASQKLALPFDPTSDFQAWIKRLDARRGKIKIEEWRAQADDLRTFLGEFVSSLPQFACPKEWRI